MEIIFELAGDALVAGLFGELDHHCAEKVRRDIDSTMAEYETRDLILDFSRVSFMDSSGIGVVLGRYKKLKETGGRVMICGASGTVRNILTMAGVFSLTPCVETKEKAIACLERKEVS